MAHGTRPDALPIRADEAAAAEADGQNIGHAEIGAHAADINHRIRLPGETATQHADIRSRSADIDHDGLIKAGEPASPAQGIGGAGGESQRRKAAGEIRIHQRAVVLADIEPAVQATFPDRPDERVDHALGEA